MATWAEHLGRTDRAWIVYATVQGVGDSDGLWRFSSSEGWTLAAGEGSWRPWMTQLPDVLSQRVPYAGGGVATESGSLTLELVDIGEALTAALQFDRGPAAYMAAAATAAATSITIDTSPSTAGISPGSILYLGSEALEVSAAPGTTLTVSRGELGTTGRPHASGAPVHLYPPYLRRREVRLYLAPLDGGESEAQLVGTYLVDDLAWSEDLTTWVLRASLAEGYLDRIVPRAPVETATARFVERDGQTWADAHGLYVRRVWSQDQTARLKAVDGDEVIELDIAGRVTRAFAGTSREDVEDVERWRVVLVGQTDFRYQPAGSRSSDRTDSAWVASDHWVDILLCLLLSPALETGSADNYDAAATEGLRGRNYSGLPPGYGVGLPYTELDWLAWEEARAALDLRLPYLVVGGESGPLRGIIDPILRAAGAVLTQEEGLLRLVVPRLLTESETPSVTITDDVLLSGSDGLPSLRVSRPTADLLTTIRYVVGPQEVDRVVTWAEDFGRLFDPDDYLQLDGAELKLEVPGGDPRQDGPLLRAGLRKLWQAYRPALLLEMELDPSAGVWGWRLGESASVDLPAVVDLAAGVRGLTGAAQLIEREPRIDPRRGVFVVVRCLVQPNIRLGLISPAADVTSVAGAVATCAANRYTSTDAPSGLPGATDAQSFTVGDVVQLLGADGAPLAGGSTETVDAISGNALTLSGDFSGDLVAGTTIYTADADEQVSRQSSRYAAMGASPLWSYA